VFCELEARDFPDIEFGDDPKFGQIHCVNVARIHTIDGIDVDAEVTARGRGPGSGGGSGGGGGYLHRGVAAPEI
jgi:hypothetical protein